MHIYRILLMFPSWENKGGVTNFCKLLIKNLNSNFNIDHLEIGNRAANKSLIKRLYFFYKNTLKLRKKLIQNRYNVIHLNPSLEIFSLIRDSFYLSIINKYYFNHSLVLFHGWNESLYGKIIKNSLYNNLFINIYKKANLILVLCNKFKKQLVKMGIPSEKVKVITTMFQCNRTIQCYKRNKLNDKKINILFMSRFEKSKGLYIVASVGKLLIENGYKDLKLIFAGDGPEYKGLMNYISRYKLKHYIDAPGYIIGEKKWEILRNSDIFLYPTYYGEGCPLVILEAMGAGLAVVSTPVAAIPDIVRNNENGFIIKSKDPKDFYEAVKKLIEDRDLLKKIQKLNREKAEKNYEAKIVTKKIESIYLSIINE